MFGDWSPWYNMKIVHLSDEKLLPSRLNYIAYEGLAWLGDKDCPATIREAWEKWECTIMPILEEN